MKAFLKEWSYFFLGLSMLAVGIGFHVWDLSDPCGPLQVKLDTKRSGMCFQLAVLDQEILKYSGVIHADRES